MGRALQWITLKYRDKEHNMKDPFERPARPWDLFNKNIGRVEEEIADQRLEICLGCPQLIKLTTQCKECGCIMSAKTKLPNAECPLGKWGQVRVSTTE
jgi:hypothetical protein